MDGWINVFQVLNAVYMGYFCGKQYKFAPNPIPIKNATMIKDALVETPKRKRMATEVK
jgi:hypothetical protein